jgi:hypothetical protein
MTTTIDEVLDLFKQVAQAQKETERSLQEFIAENKDGFEKLRKEIKELNQSWGRFVESMVAPACETLFQNRGIPVHRVMQRIKGQANGETMEIDVLVTNQDHALVVEVKSRLSVRDVQDFIEDLDDFRRFFPEYNKKHLYGAVAGIDIEEGADKYAYRQGLFVLAQTGDTITVLNGEQFQPKNW